MRVLNSNLICFFKLVTFEWKPYLSIIGCIAANDLQIHVKVGILLARISVCSTSRTNFVAEWYVAGVPILLEIF